MESLRALPDRIVVYFICDNKHEHFRTKESILRSVLNQVLTLDPSLVRHAMSYWKRMNDSIATSSATMWTILNNIIEDRQRSKPIYFVLDALDECEEESREWILKKLGQLFTASRTESESARQSGTLKVIVTSRPWEDIEFEFRGMTNIRLKTELEDAIDEDLAIFIRSRVQALAKRCRYTPEMQQLVMEALLAKANGMFLWASLIIKDLSRTPIRQIEQRVKDLPASLYGLYDSILAKVDQSATDRVKCILEWVVTAFRPLTIEELALACEIASLDAASPPDMEDLVSSMKWDIGLCGPLLTVRYGVVHLVHQSAKDYLLNQHARLKQSSNASFQIDSTESHAKIAELCLTYFAPKDRFAGDFMSRKPHPSSGRHASGLAPQDDTVFLKYSMDYWAEHIRESKYCTPALLLLMKNFFSWYQRAMIQLQGQFYYTLTGGRAYQNYLAIHSSGSPLQFAIYLGLTPVIEASLDDSSVDVNAPDDFGATPLMRCMVWPRNSNLEFELKRDAIVRMLLGHGASVHSTDFSSATPLHWAASHGNYQVVETLIEAGARIDSQDCEGRTPLHRAVCATHPTPEAIRILLSHGADVNFTDHKGITPLLQLVSSIYSFNDPETAIETIICVLCGAGANVNHRRHDGLSPLQAAFDWKIWGVARLLLKYGACIALADPGDWKFLQRAIEMNDLDLATLLLKASSKFDSQHSALVPLLQMAAADGCVEIVQLLLEHCSCITSREGEKYLSGARLHHAALEGNVDLLDSLLRIDTTCDFDTMDSYDMNILQQAVTSGNSNAVKLLCDKMIDTEVGIICKGKALWLAAAKGNDAIIDCLLGSGAPLEGTKYEPNDASTQLDWLREVLSKDNFSVVLVQSDYAENWNPLVSATLSGHEMTVNLLLERGADIEAKDSEGPSPLQTAIAYGHETVVRALLKSGAKKSGSLLHLACSRGYESMVRLLLADGGFGMETKDLGGRTPLLAAVENGQVEILTLLLNEGADYEARGAEECTSLMLAATVNSEEIVRALLQKGVSIEATDQRGRTALHFAAEEGHEAILKVLLENGADWRHKDNDGKTPLMSAVHGPLVMPGVFEPRGVKIAAGLLREWEAEHEELV